MERPWRCFLLPASARHMKTDRALERKTEWEIQRKQERKREWEKERKIQRKKERKKDGEKRQDWCPARGCLWTEILWTSEPKPVNIQPMTSYPPTWYHRHLISDDLCRGKCVITPRIQRGDVMQSYFSLYVPYHTIWRHTIHLGQIALVPEDSIAMILPLELLS